MTSFHALKPTFPGETNQAHLVINIIQCDVSGDGGQHTEKVDIVHPEDGTELGSLVECRN